MTLRVLEFFSGLGGLHFALDETAIPYIMVAAYDNNAVANAVYHHNFGMKPITSNIEHVPTFPQADLWLLSPPCQPYTRGGKLLDSKDHRAAALAHLIKCLLQMDASALPKYLLLENVLNFEKSQSRAGLISALATRGYKIQEFLISPMDAWIGIPNDRLRYYLIAEKVQEESSLPIPLPIEGEGIIRDLSQVLGPAHPCENLKIKDYLREEGADTRYFVPETLLATNRHYRHDVVRPESPRSATFTKAYGSKHIIGTGSLLQTDNLSTDHYQAELYPADTLWRLGLRFFTPCEIAKLHGLPIGKSLGEGRREFSFPEQVSLQQQYRLLGNSLNVKVVFVLLKHLLRDYKPGHL